LLDNGGSGFGANPIIIIIIIIINSSTDIEKFAYKKLQLMSRNGKVITTLTAAHK